MIKVIIFDWHGVLDQVKFAGLIERFSELTHESIKDIEAKVKFLAQKYERGGNPEIFWTGIKINLGLNDTDIKVAQDYILQVVPNESLWKQLDSLGSHYRLAILSDCPEDKLQTIKRFSDLKEFECRYFSCEKKTSKSDDTFFTDLLHDLNLSAEECLYVDDNQRHVQTAQRLGFKICLFSKTKDLNDCLM